MRQPYWDQYETVLLIEAYCKIKENKESRKAVISELSSTLRSRAKNHGIVIDATYRNENGIGMRLGELEYLFSSEGSGLKNTSDLFREMVRLFLDDNNKFEKILMEAKGVTGSDNNVCQQFCEWLKEKAPKTQMDSICRSLLVAEEFCRKITVLSKPLFETTDEETIRRFVKTVSRNKIFRIKNKKNISSIISAAEWYYAFIRALPSIPRKENTVELASSTVTDSEDHSFVDFNLSSSLAFTKPIALVFHGYRDASISNWANLYVKLVSKLYDNYSDFIPVGESFTGSGRADFGNEDVSRAMTAPKPINTQMYLETNLSATNIVSKIKALLDICGIDYSQVVIEYQKKSSSDIVPNDAVQHQESTSVTTEKRNIIEFSEWLSVIDKMAAGTCRSYVSALKKSEEYATKMDLSSKKIIGAGSDEALATIALLMTDEEFKRINQEQHNRFSAAFQKLEKYYRYLGSEAAEPLCGSPGKSNILEVSKIDSTQDELSKSMNILLKENSNGISKEDILTHFYNFSTHQVNRALIECHAVKVLKKYYHKDNISDYDEMASILLDVLLKQFAANGDYTSAQQLYNDAHIRLDDFFFYNNAFESRPEVYDLAVHLFTQEKYKGYSFLFINGMHIWKTEPDYPKDFHGLLIKFAREHQNIFTREQALAFFESIGSATPAQSFSNILFTAGSKSFLQYDENCFVLKEALSISNSFLSALKAQIENLLEGEAYIAMGEIDDYFYTTLPSVPANISWSPLLIEDMLRIFDIGYITVEAGEDNDKKTIPAAILRKDSPFKTFPDLVWNEVSNEYSLPKEFTAIEFREFLLDKGFIHGSEKMWNVHKTVAGDLRFYWTENNSKVTIN